jgi:peptide-methionine (S)-S-oxide reductase
MKSIEFPGPVFTRTTTPLAIVLATFLAGGAMAGPTFPNPVKDAHAAPNAGRQKAVMAGGCFWGVEAVFERLNGVVDVLSGYAGGTQQTAQYASVGTGTSGHAESVEITFDPSIVSYGTLLKVFFAVAHDPTELNRQGPDEGTQYRSAIFYANDEQKDVAESYIRQLNAAHVFARPIVTTVNALKGFYRAEPEHQNFLVRHPDYPYVVVNDLPKLRALDAEFPELLKPGIATAKK